MNSQFLGMVKNLTKKALVRAVTTVSFNSIKKLAKELCVGTIGWVSGIVLPIEWGKFVLFRNEVIEAEDLQNLIQFALVKSTIIIVSDKISFKEWKKDQKKR